MCQSQEKVLSFLLLTAVSLSQQQILLDDKSSRGIIAINDKCGCFETISKKYVCHVVKKFGRKCSRQKTNSVNLQKCEQFHNEDM